MQLRNARLQAGRYTASALKMQSSRQFKECLVEPEPSFRSKPEPAEPPLVHTRTMMLEKRRAQDAVSAAARHEAFLASTAGVRRAA